MPIRPELRHFYTGAWRETRLRILQRAKNRCERCRKPNRVEVVMRTWHGRMWWRPLTANLWRTEAGRLHRTPDSGCYRERYTNVVLTIAHLNQIAGDDRDENLAALCQWCHLTHDRQQHIRSSKETRLTRKDRSRPILQEVS
jgi:hypothetical protein